MSDELPALLSFAAPGATILRERAGDVTFPLDEAMRSLLSSMQRSITNEGLRESGACWPSAAGMAAPQWGQPHRIFLWRQLPDGSRDVAINASYEPLGDETTDAFEGCFSVPARRGLVRRFTRIRAAYQTPSGQHVVEELQDWPARVFQHETDHCDGFVYCDERRSICLELVDVKTDETK